uniref:Putative mitochondrial outer membrane protein n=1 Tax=Xenopsylla cheopis TaxID=163159 RepID=A0A6M2DI72_XENCH
MPKVLLNEAMTLEVGAADPWPNDVQLFQPLEVEQILLPDNANCLAVKAYLKMCNLPYTVEYRHNAEFMSPTGQVPFIKCGAFLIAELENIVSFINKKDISLTKDLDKSTKLDMRAYMTLVNNILSFAELYITWVDKNTLHQVTYPRNAYPYPWPLSTYQNFKKRNQIIRKLKAHEWYNYSITDVLNKVEKCCSALSEKLGSSDYFFGNKPTELDALLFGHLFCLITTTLPQSSPQIAPIISKFKNLTDFCRRIDKTYFPRKTAN